MKIRAIVPLIDSIEGALICSLMNQDKDKVFFVTLRLFDSVEELTRFKQLMDFLHTKNKSNFFHYVNLEKDFEAMTPKFHSKEMKVFFGEENQDFIKIELKNSILRYLSSTLNASVLEISGKLTHVLGKQELYCDEPSPIKNLNKSDIYELARKHLPKDLVMHYIASDLEKLKDLPFEDIKYKDIDHAVDELANPQNALKKSLNNEYTQEQYKLMNFFLEKACK